MKETLKESERTERERLAKLAERDREPSPNRATRA